MGIVSPIIVTPDENTDPNCNWLFSPFTPIDEKSSLEGNSLGFLYYSILQHINNSYLEPPNLENYLSIIMVCRKSLIQRIDNE